MLCLIEEVFGVVDVVEATAVLCFAWCVVMQKDKDLPGPDRHPLYIHAMVKTFPYTR